MPLFTSYYDCAWCVCVGSSSKVPWKEKENRNRYVILDSDKWTAKKNREHNLNYLVQPIDQKKFQKVDKITVIHRKMRNDGSLV